jgi:hypothetical protein
MDGHDYYSSLSITISIITYKHSTIMFLLYVSLQCVCTRELNSAQLTGYNAEIMPLFLMQLQSLHAPESHFTVRAGVPYLNTHAVNEQPVTDNVVI